MTTLFETSTTDSQMPNNIMAAGSKDCPPMLATRKYAQWRSRFLRYIDTRPNGDALWKCILEVPEHTTVETLQTLSPENKAHYESEKEVIHLILTGIEDEIYSTVDACKTALEIWEAIERLQQEIAKPITPPSESASKEDSDPKQAQRDKVMQKNLALIAKYFKKIYKPTNNNLKTSSNTKNKNVDTTPRYQNDNQSAQFGNQRTMTVVEARENEYRKPKRVKDFTYHKEKMLLYKQAKQGVPLQGEQSDWIADMDEEIDEQELKEHHSYMAKIQQNDQNVVECDDERIALANLIANLKLDVDENKKIQKKLKKENASLTQELTECKSILAETSRTLGRLLAQKDIDTKEGLKLKAYEILVVKEKHDELVKHSLLTKLHYEGLVKEKIKVITDLKQKDDRDIDKMISMEKQLQPLNEIVYKRNQTIQTINMLAPKGPTFNCRPTFANPMYLNKDPSEKPCLYETPYDQSDPTNRLVPDREETLTLTEESRSKVNKEFMRPYEYTKLNSLYKIFKPASQRKS
nr:hypothetical protein [Tanacetum cinerariifolium]